MIAPLSAILTESKRYTSESTARLDIRIPLTRTSIVSGGILTVTKQLKMKESPSVTTTLPVGLMVISGTGSRKHAQQ